MTAAPLPSESDAKDQEIQYLRDCIVRQMNVITELKAAADPALRALRWRQVACLFHDSLVGKGMAGKTNFRLQDEAVAQFDALMETETAAGLDRVHPGVSEGQQDEQT